MDSGIVLRYVQDYGFEFCHPLLLLLKVDAVTVDAAEVTFVEYGNSATCALGQLQPWDALIDEDGQLV